MSTQRLVGPVLWSLLSTLRYLWDACNISGVSFLLPTIIIRTFAFLHLFKRRGYHPYYYQIGASTVIESKPPNDCQSHTARSMSSVLRVPYLIRWHIHVDSHVGHVSNFSMVCKVLTVINPEQLLVSKLSLSDPPLLYFVSWRPVNTHL